jgi:hypothetical protein
MFKSICARAIVPVAIAVTGFVVVCCILLYAAIKSDMTDSSIAHSTNLADMVIKSIRHAMLHDDRETVRNMISNIGEQQGVEHVRIFNKKGLVMFSENPREINHFVDKNSAGCVGCHAGPVPTARLEDMQKARIFVNNEKVKVMAITAPIYNEPTCSSNAACHVHPEAQRVLGTLDIGLDQAPLRKTLALLGSRMVIFSLMVLVLTVGGVSALLSRNVFKPIRLLTDFTDRAIDGSLKANLPPLGGDLEQLCANFRLLLLRTGHNDPRSRSAPGDGVHPQQESAHGACGTAPANPTTSGDETTRPRSKTQDP